MSSLKKGTPLYLFLVTCAVIIAVLLTSSFAWFVMNHEVTVSSASDKNLAVQINAGDLEIAVSYQIATIGDEHYGEFTEYSEFGDNLEMSIPTPQFMDVTGNGKSLWFPSYLGADDKPDYGASSIWSDVTDDMNYCMTLHLKFRTSQEMDVYLDKRSFIQGLEELTGPNITRSSSISNWSFSADAICGCARAAFLEVDDAGNETLKAVWIPNDNLHISYVDSTAVLDTSYNTHVNNVYWVMYGNNMRQHLYGITADAINHPWDPNSCYFNGSVLVGNGNLAQPANETVSSSMANFGAPLLHFDKNGVVQTKEMIVRVWFEGTDNEADKACDNGMVKFNFGFTGVNKTEASDAAVTAIGGVKVSGEKLRWADDTDIDGPKNGVTLMYSYDCIDWIPWGTNQKLDKTHTVIYLRGAETETEFGTAIRTLTIASQ